MLNRVESTDIVVKELKGDVLNLTQMTSSHSTFIKHLAAQMNHLSAKMNSRMKGTLLSDTLLNLKNDGHCLDITIRSRLVLNNVRI